MPSKANILDDSQFLAACFMHCTDKPRVNFERLSVAIGMNAGGASNKYRTVIRKLEDEGRISWLESDIVSPKKSQGSKQTTGLKRKIPAKASKKSTKDTTKTPSRGQEIDATLSEEETSEPEVVEDDDKEEEDTALQVRSKKKAKTNGDQRIG